MRRAGLILGRGVAAAVMVVAMVACGDGNTPDVGELAAVFARPAERVQILSLGRNQTFGEVLEGRMDGNEQYSFLLAFREQASPRRMRPGTEITFRYLTDGGQALRGVDVAMNSDETVRLTKGFDGWRSEMIETPTFVDTLFVSGEIESNLWNAVVGSPQLQPVPREDRARLIDYMDRVFQWQVDFSRQIQVGDTYRVAFEREVRPDGTMRVGRLLAAEMVNAGTPYHAVWFDPNDDGAGSYYDLEGQSVRRAFLLRPLEFRRISGRFSSGRFHPILQRVRAHRGIDYAADSGTPIQATADGVIIKRGPNGGLGNAIEIRHPNGFITRYGHMSGFRRGVTVGTRVHQGDVIGYVGMTGLATGPHLHYEMLRGGRHMDPLSVDLPAGDPVPSEDMDRWLEESALRVALLELIPPAGPARTVVVDQDSDDAQEDTGG